MAQMAQASRTPYTILIVDDEKIQRDTLAELLEHRGYGVTVAAGVVEGITILSTNTAPDLVLSDFKMPDGTGLDIASHCLEVTPSTDVMIMTAYADIQSVIAAMQVGVVDYLLKPLNMEALFRKIEVLEERRGLKREVRLLRTELNRMKSQKSFPTCTS